jgi:hypothetical protein
MTIGDLLKAKVANPFRERQACKKQKAAREFEQLSDVIHTISINPISFEIKLNSGVKLIIIFLKKH